MKLGFYLEPKWLPDVGALMVWGSLILNGSEQNGEMVLLFFLCYCLTCITAGRDSSCGKCVCVCVCMGVGSSGGMIHLHDRDTCTSLSELRNEIQTTQTAGTHTVCLRVLPLTISPSLPPPSASHTENRNIPSSFRRS